MHMVESKGYCVNQVSSVVGIILDCSKRTLALLLLG